MSVTLVIRDLRKKNNQLYKKGDAGDMLNTKLTIWSHVFILSQVMMQPSIPATAASNGQSPTVRSR